MCGLNLQKMLIPLYLAVSLVVLGDDDKEVKREAVFYGGKSAMTVCVNKFISCSPPELIHAAEHRNVDTLCRLFPSVIVCMEKALSKYCQNSRHYHQVKMLYNELDRMEGKYSSSQCNIENHGISLVPSILQMCCLVIFAAWICLS